MKLLVVYPIVTTALLVLFFFWPSIKSILKKTKKRSHDFSTAGAMSYAVGEFVDGFERSLNAIAALILYSLSWIIWFILFMVL
jgi:hypothetical protein